MNSLAELHARTSDAREELAAIDSRDPVARHAVLALRLTRLTLECFWLPALSELLERRDARTT